MCSSVISSWRGCVSEQSRVSEDMFQWDEAAAVPLGLKLKEKGEGRGLACVEAVVPGLGVHDGIILLILSL